MLSLIDQNTGEGYHIPEDNISGVRAISRDGKVGYEVYLIDPMNDPDEGEMVVVNTGTKEGQPQAVKQVRKYLGFPFDCTAEDWSSS